MARVGPQRHGVGGGTRDLRFVSRHVDLNPHVLEMECGIH